MSDAQFPEGGGWLLAYVAAGAIVVKFLDPVVDWLFRLVRWKWSADEARLKKIAEPLIKVEVEAKMSAHVQTVAERMASHQKQLDLHESRLGAAFADINDAKEQAIARDERLVRDIREEIKSTLRDLDRRVAEHIGGQYSGIVRQIDQMGKHFSELLTMALKAKPPGE